MNGFVFLMCFLIGFVCVYSCCYMMRNVFRCKIRNFVIYSLGGGTLTAGYMLITKLLAHGTMPINNIVMGAVFVPLIWFFVTDRSLKSVAAAISAYAFFNCTQVLICRMIDQVMKYIEKLDKSELVICSVQLAGQALAVGVMILISRIGRSSIKEPMSVWNVLFVALLAIFTETITMSAWSMGEESITGVSFIGQIGLSLLSIAFMVISVVMTVKFNESRYYSSLNSMNESYLNAQKDYYAMKQTSDTEIRRMRHDMKNHLICIRDLAANGRYDELADYIGELSEAVNDADRLIHTGSGIIDAIVNEKAALAKKLHIKFDWEGTISGLNISAIDSCTLVANLLDNAIEACEKVDVAKRYISLSFRRSEHFLLMTCVNSAARIVELSNGRPLTSKADRFNHGFGIGNIERCVEKYGGHLDLASYLEDEVPIFRAEAVIPLGME